ncbi:MAG: hypothetical protein WAK48_05360 [Candidatus Acidiferrum sp.]|jgi:hypothetical protein
MGTDEPAPAIVSLNTTIAGLAVTAGFNLFVNLTGGLQPLNQLYDATDGIVFSAKQEHDVGCDIRDEAAGVKALGDKQIVSGTHHTRKALAESRCRGSSPSVEPGSERRARNRV